MITFGSCNRIIPIILIVFTAAVAAVNAQDEPIPGRRGPIHLQFNNAPVGRALQELADQAGIKLMMDKPVGDAAISIDLVNVTPKQALEALLQKANLRYEFVSEDIVIVTDAPANKEPLKASIEELASRPKEKLLFGHLEHSQTLSPLAPALRAGAQFDVGNLKALTPNNYWYKIPLWSVGTWHKETCTTVHSQTFQPVDSLTISLASFGLAEMPKNDDWETDTHLARDDETWGFQKDRNGDIWEFVYNNYLTHTEGETTYTVSFVKDVQVLDVSDSKVTLKYLATSLLVGKYSRRIGIARQTESIQTYSSAGGNMRRCEGSVKVFDENGQPESIDSIISVQLRTAPFHSWNMYHGRDMRALFAEYLNSHGMHDLIPDNYRALLK